MPFLFLLIFKQYSSDYALALMSLDVSYDIFLLLIFRKLVTSRMILLILSHRTMELKASTGIERFGTICSAKVPFHVGFLTKDAST